MSIRRTFTRPGAAAMLVLVATHASFAQRIEPVAASSRSVSTDATSRQSAQGEVKKRPLLTWGGVGGGIVGGTAGVFAGMLAGVMVAHIGTCSGEDCSLGGALVGAAVGEVVGSGRRSARRLGWSREPRPRGADVRRDRRGWRTCPAPPKRGGANHCGSDSPAPTRGDAGVRAITIFTEP